MEKVLSFAKSRAATIYIRTVTGPAEFRGMVGRNDRNHYFGLGPIPKPKPKLAILSADTVTDTFRSYLSPISIGMQIMFNNF